MKSADVLISSEILWKLQQVLMQAQSLKEAIHMGMICKVLLFATCHGAVAYGTIYSPIKFKNSTQNKP